MTRETPCAGWTVADLIRHMNDEHEAIIQTVLGPSTTAQTIRARTSL
jgi:mycothiol maleylpyruvate isomerase-like protein